MAYNFSGGNTPAPAPAAGGGFSFGAPAPAGGGFSFGSTPAPAAGGSSATPGFGKSEGSKDRMAPSTSGSCRTIHVMVGPNNDRILAMKLKKDSVTWDRLRKLMILSIV